MIRAQTPAGKRALAKSLAQHAPDHLEWITMLSRALGGTSAVYMELDDKAVNAQISADMKAAKKKHIEAQK